MGRPTMSSLVIRVDPPEQSSQSHEGWPCQPKRALMVVGLKMHLPDLHDAPSHSHLMVMAAIGHLFVFGVVAMTAEPTDHVICLLDIGMYITPHRARWITLDALATQRQLNLHRG